MSMLATLSGLLYFVNIMVSSFSFQLADKQSNRNEGFHDLGKAEKVRCNHEIDKLNSLLAQYASSRQKTSQGTEEKTKNVAPATSYESNDAQGEAHQTFQAENGVQGRPSPGQGLEKVLEGTFQEERHTRVFDAQRN